MSSRKFKPPASSTQPQNTGDAGESSVSGNYRLQETSATPTSESDNKTYTFTGVTPGKAYLHPPDKLISGRVMYRVKFAGYMIVKDPRGPGVAKDAIDKLLGAAAVKLANTGEDMQPVTLSISIRSILCVERENKKILHQHPLSLISFSADDKRNKGNIFAYIARAKPPSHNHICYVFECSGTQASELTATVGQAFELAYKEFLKTKKAQEQLKQLKQRLETCSPEEKEEILKQINVVEEARAKQAAAVRAEVEKKRALESEKVISPNAPSEQTGREVTSTAVPETQHLDHTPQTSDLDDAISKFSNEVSELEEAFSKKRPANYGEHKVPDRSPTNDEMMEKIEEKLKEMEATTESDDMDIDFPTNFVLGSFHQARKSSMPKKGSVKDAASSWFEKHHD